MSQGRKRILLAGTWLLTVVVANYVGGVVGFFHGTRTELSLSGLEAFETILVLRSRRAGNIDESISLLETQLDSEIVVGLFGQPAYDSPYNILRLFLGNEAVDRNDRFFSEVLEYREEFPSQADEPVRTKIMDGLEVYRDAPRRRN